MPNHRRYSEEQLRRAIETSTTWKAVLTALGKNPTRGGQDIRPVADRLGIDYSHIGGPSAALHPGRVLPHPFAGRDDGGRGFQVEAVAIAVAWFMGKRYPVSIPLEPVPYDLIAESDTGLQRIQVKSSRYAAPNGQFQVHLRRTSYVAPDGARPGYYKQIRYTAGDLDFFFIVCSDGHRYLIPFEAVDGLAQIMVTTKYDPYRVE